MSVKLKQSTTVTIRLGPILDKADGVTEKTAIGASLAVEVSKNHGAFGARNSATATSHDANGWYAVELNATDTGTLGPLIVKTDDSTSYLPAWREFEVVPAEVYDTDVAGSDNRTVDVTSGAQTAIFAAVMKGDWTTLSGEASRSVLNALRVLRNKWSVSGGTVTFTKEDDTTSAFTSALTTDNTAQPITASDPT